jgi:hypothetical protein
MCLKIINVSLISISNFTNNKLFILKIYKIKIFVVASAIINRDIFCVNLCVYFIYFLLGIIHKMKANLIIFLKRNNCFMLDLLRSSTVTSFQRPSSIVIVYSTLSLIQTFIYPLPQIMLKIVKRNIFIYIIKMFTAGNHFTCHSIASNP